MLNETAYFLSQKSAGNFWQICQLFLGSDCSRLKNREADK